MSAPSLIEWNGLVVRVGDDGTLGSVCLAGHTSPLISDMRVVLGDGWEQAGTEVLLDEVEQRYRFAPGGHELATAVVRQTFDATWSLRLQLTNRTAEQLTVPGARLDMTTAWPTRRWLAGAEGTISLDAGREDGALLTFTQTRGRSRLSDGQTWLTDLPVVLAPAGSPAATYQVSWRADWLRDELMQAAALPGWWPERHVLTDGDIVELHLPDAAIEAAGINVLEHDETTVLTALPGHHMAQVHAGRGTTDVELFWAASLVDGHVVPAARRLLARDPRSLADHEVFLLGRAHAARPLGDEAAWLVADAAAALADRCLARSTPTPLALAAVADEVIRTGAPELADALPGIAARLPLVPGAVLALLHANLAARLTGRTAPLPFPGGPHPADPVQAALLAVEVELLDPPDALPRQALRVAGLLGAGLPGVVVDDLTRAIVWAVTGLFPEGWDTLHRWPVGIGGARDAARDELLARRCDDEALAWLLW